MAFQGRRGCGTVDLVLLCYGTPGPVGYVPRTSGGSKPLTNAITEIATAPTNTNITTASDKIAGQVHRAR